MALPDTSRDRMVREMLTRVGAGALIGFRADEVVLLTGCLPHWGISVCLYPRDTEPILYIPELEPEDRLPSHLRIRKYGWGRLDCPDPWSQLMDLMRSDLARIHLNTMPVVLVKSIGQSAPAISSAEGLPYSPKIVELFASLGSGFKEADQEILSLYTIKTKSEIKAIELTHAVTRVGVEAFYANLQPGKAEAEVASAVETAIQNQTGERGVFYAKALAMVLSGPNTVFGGWFNRNTGRKLDRGELVMMELAVCVNGYWADVTRTGRTGPLGVRHQKIYETVIKAQQAAIRAIKPGVSVSKIDAVARSVVEKAGFGKFFNHATGHQVGFRYHDPGPFLVPGADSVLQTGMIVTVEPGIYGEKLKGGCRVEDNVLVTDHGYRILSDYPRSLDGRSDQQKTKRK